MSATQTPAAIPTVADDRYIDAREVAARLSISVATLYRWIKSGHFPGPVTLVPGTVRWSHVGVQAWIEGKKPSSSTSGTSRPEPVRRQGAA